jgi:hypothetical protein
MKVEGRRRTYTTEGRRRTYSLSFFSLYVLFFIFVFVFVLEGNKLQEGRTAFLPFSFIFIFYFYFLFCFGGKQTFLGKLQS